MKKADAYPKIAKYRETRKELLKKIYDEIFHMVSEKLTLA